LVRILSTNPRQTQSHPHQLNRQQQQANNAGLAVRQDISRNNVQPGLQRMRIVELQLSKEGSRETSKPTAERIGSGLWANQEERKEEEEERERQE
jgi:hypothetical protein